MLEAVSHHIDEYMSAILFDFIFSNACSMLNAKLEFLISMSYIIFCYFVGRL